MADGQRTPDELKQARDRRVFAQTLQEVKQHHPYEHRRERNVRIILEAGSFSEDDLLRMLRGQLLCWDGDACQQTVRLPADEPEDIDPGEEYDTGDELLRRIGQSGLGGPLGPVPHPRNHLMCPLQERALSGDKSVPCHEALRQAIAPGDRFVDVEPEIGDSYAMMYIKMGGLQPCQEFFCLALDSLGSLVKQSARGDADEGQAEREARAHLKHLLQTGRLTEEDLQSILFFSAVATDAEWLPCRDDPQRHVWFSPVEYMDLDDYILQHLNDVPPERMRCPMQVRAMLGDATVPCCEAQLVQPNQEMIDKVEKWQESALPAKQLDREDGPGSPKDPVRVLRLRPCHLLGQLLAGSLYPLASHLRDKP